MEHGLTLPTSEQLTHFKRSQKSGAFWRLWLRRYKTRKQLHALLIGDSDRLHHDLGLSREKVLAEISKPFWR